MLPSKIHATIQIKQKHSQFSRLMKLLYDHYRQSVRYSKIGDRELVRKLGANCSRCQRSADQQQGFRMDCLGVLQKLDSIRDERLNVRELVLVPVLSVRSSVRPFVRSSIHSEAMLIRQQTTWTYWRNTSYENFKKNFKTAI